MDDIKLFKKYIENQIGPLLVNDNLYHVICTMGETIEATCTLDELNYYYDEKGNIKPPKWYEPAIAKHLLIIRNIDSQIAMGQAYAANPNGMMAAATGTAMQNAASNPNGAMNGFVGLNMAQGVGGNAINAANQAPVQPMPAGSTPNPGEVNVNITTPNFPGSDSQQQ